MIEIIIGFLSSVLVQVAKRWVPFAKTYPKPIVIALNAVGILLVFRLVGLPQLFSLILAVGVSVGTYEIVLKFLGRLTQ